MHLRSPAPALADGVYAMAPLEPDAPEINVGARVWCAATAKAARWLLNNFDFFLFELIS
jgi:hypothetical protein